MAREVFVKLGGEDRRLRFTTREGIELKRRFNKTPKRLLHEDIAPSANGRPTLDFDPEVVVAALFLGLRHELRRKESEVTVEQWFDVACKAGEAVLIVNQLVDAIMLDGITGQSIDFEARRAAREAEDDEPAPRQAPDPEDDEGKAVRPPDNP